MGFLCRYTASRQDSNKKWVFIQLNNTPATLPVLYVQVPVPVVYPEYEQQPQTPPIVWWCSPHW